ncbi:MAG: flagellar hook-length control protein FliK [gamma proteobacterium symbiont of Bathyaustriella thionipta]|nr:flagellar hook-length control protein FliK [gamma proteobacterium symbiont of Bathyaustriella thionipta]MCU7949527.1 flagellar hook-length control protein FliK [gamma proteobacterium symbiont of Bathyaustriella thionipta]MCU7954257.1 flagellar hook-length control protein FliK [gamma proteobacterium symbiont of Bathyaustriella thionipta]MCU7956127.1 flagellar hook-length control protein FliK [gamma proteobacterium symbiont of Bathyaustriella thionipta]MCU7968728.1 flagellar hook-length contro
MDTTHLLTIKPSSTDAITGQALAMFSSDNKSTDLFKSAFKDQMEKKRNEPNHSEKNLPQNGNDLPEKKTAVDKNENSHQSNKDEHASKTEHDRPLTQNNNASTNDSEQDRDDEQKSRHEQTETNKQANSAERNNSPERNNSHERNNSPEHDNSPPRNNSSEQASTEQVASGQINTIEQENALGQINHLVSETMQNEVTQAINPQQLDESIENELIAQQSDSEQHLQSELNASGINNPLYAGTDNLAIDKSTQAEMSKKQIVSGYIAANGHVISDSASKTGLSSGSENKNESSLNKSIADFQQFIEMSKKHSMAGEAIASVKSFEQKMHTQQLSAQVLMADSKLPAGQTTAQPGSVQAVVQPALLDRMNTSLNTVQSLSQTTSSLEVKAGVGKAGWNQSFSNQIVMMANNAIQQAKIRLNPMNLGPVEAMVKLSGETAVVNLTSLHLTTKEAMESAIPRLKEMLNENGFSQVDVNLSHQDKREQQEAGLDSNSGSNNEHGNSTMPGDEQLSEETPDSETGTQVSELDEQGLNIVDYYA